MKRAKILEKNSQRQYQRYFRHLFSTAVKFNSINSHIITELYIQIGCKIRIIKNFVKYDLQNENGLYMQKKKKRRKIRKKEKGEFIDKEEEEGVKLLKKVKEKRKIELIKKDKN